MRLISWNLNARRANASAQIAAILRREPDVVALQEITPTTLPAIRDAMASGGLRYLADSFALAPAAFQPSGPRRFGQLTASRHPVTAEPPDRFAVPWPERVLSVRVNAPGCDLEIHNTHVPPGSSNGWIKISMLEGMFAALAVRAINPRVLCGDFNTPQAELASGEVVTWAQRQKIDGRWRVVGRRAGRPGSEWDRGERQVLGGLAVFDLVDVFGSLHGYDVSDASWVARRGDREVGRRFDHIFASRSLRPETCSYLHEFRTAGLSDHSPIEAVFDHRAPAL